MKKTKNEVLPRIVDPGYLMLATYVLGVTVLVLFSWFGAVGSVSSAGTAASERTVAQNELSEGGMH